MMAGISPSSARFHRASDEVSTLNATICFSCALLTACERFYFGTSTGTSPWLILPHVFASDPMQIYAKHSVFFEIAMAVELYSSDI